VAKNHNTVRLCFPANSIKVQRLESIQDKTLFEKLLKEVPDHLQENIYKAWEKQNGHSNFST